MATEAAHLSVEDESMSEPLFADYRAEAPPAPRLNSAGIVATDITAEFTDAASSMFMPEATLYGVFVLIVL